MKCSVPLLYIYSNRLQTFAMRRSTLGLLLLVLTLISCKETKSNSETNSISETTATDENKYKNVKFDSDKDFICGMPVSAGVSDTAHYKGKVYGFCAAECKVEFLKNPESYLTQSKQ